MFRNCQEMRKILIFGIVILALDQFTKFFVCSFLDYGSSVNVVRFLNFFNITNVLNTGVAFSMFQGRNLLFSIFIFVFLLSLVFLFCQNWDKFNKIQQYAFCLIITGGFGNLIDRLFRGAVVDFLDFGIYFLRWPSFNIADFCICVAVTLIIISMVMSGNKQKV
jgi:signal peptidase II